MANKLSSFIGQALCLSLLMLQTYRAAAQTCSASGGTTNTLSYTCSALDISIPSTYTIDSDVVSNDFACAQVDGSDVDLTIDCTGIGNGTISCLYYASSGKTAGSCGSCEPSLEDGDEVEFLDETSGDACIGEANCTVSINTTITDPKFKVLAYCGESVVEETCGDLINCFIAFIAAILTAIWNILFFWL